ncbi:MAG: amino acid ABC transporter substrate-binding protein [Bacilli bacterium]|nr:amino acid ABC transporter substrate-binding protein [Bacilli bacterium]
MKKILLILFSFLLITGCSSKNENEIVMVTEAGFAPYEYYENNEIIGVDIEIAKEIAKELGKELVIKDIAFDSIINELKSNKADFALAGMSITEERQKEVDFSVEYATSRQVIITLKDSKIKKPEDIKGKKVAVQLGTVADLVLTEDYDVELTRQKKFLAAIEDVKAKKVDCVVMDYLPAKELLKENNELVILEEELFTDKYAVAVKKGNKELLDQINKVLQRLIDEGKIEEYTINYSK